MLQEVSELIGLQVYTREGLFLGNVNNIIIDVDRQRIDGLFITGTNPVLVEGSRSVSVPYRWVKAVGDVILLRFFPRRVTVRKEEVASDLIE
ncbi:MAG: PRC-barrel domain-containing protein [Thermoplasmata archaeon]|nr:PRC-barrel domain-containing protein [Thermoplasmata archaeon]